MLRTRSSPRKLRRRLLKAGDRAKRCLLYMFGAAGVVGTTSCEISRSEAGAHSLRERLKLAGIRDGPLIRAADETSLAALSRTRRMRERWGGGGVLCLGSLVRWVARNDVDFSDGWASILRDTKWSCNLSLERLSESGHTARPGAVGVGEVAPVFCARQDGTVHRRRRKRRRRLVERLAMKTRTAQEG